MIVAHDPDKPLALARSEVSPPFYPFELVRRYLLVLHTKEWEEASQKKSTLLPVVASVCISLQKVVLYRERPQLDGVLRGAFNAGPD